MTWEENIKQYPKLKEAWDTTLSEFGRCWLGGQIDIFAEQKVKNCIIANVMPSLQSLNFRKMRKAKGLTLKKVEEITGLSNAYLSQLETGKVKSPGYSVVKILYDLYSNEA